MWLEQYPQNLTLVTLGKGSNVLALVEEIQITEHKYHEARGVCVKRETENHVPRWDQHELSCLVC